jgi:hypothetical protein
MHRANVDERVSLPDIDAELGTEQVLGEVFDIIRRDAKNERQ